MSAVIWIVIAVAVIAAFAGGGQSRKRPGEKGRATRIDHPHYVDQDEHECSECGTRFRGKGMVCPQCGAIFEATKQDDGEFIEEMEIWDGDD